MYKFAAFVIIRQAVQIWRKREAARGEKIPVPGVHCASSDPEIWNMKNTKTKYKKYKTPFVQAYLQSDANMLLESRHKRHKLENVTQNVFGSNNNDMVFWQYYKPKA